MKLESRAAKLTLCGLMAALTAAGAFIRLPVAYVPVTLQTLFVLLSGSILPAPYAAGAQCAYLLCGLAGLPVFTSGGGPVAVMHPTFGYLISFPIAAVVASRINHKTDSGKNGKLDFSWKRSILANSAAVVIIFTIGVIYLFLNLNLITKTGITIYSALWFGLLVFIPGEVVKIFLASYITKKLSVV